MATRTLDPEDTRDVRDLRAMVYALTERIDSLSRMVDALRETRPTDVGAWLARGVDDALKGDKSRAIVDALALEMTAFRPPLNGRTLVTHATRGLASIDPDAVHFPRTGASEIPLEFARYLAEPSSASNRYGSHVTRRVHNMLAVLGVA